MTERLAVRVADLPRGGACSAGARWPGCSERRGAQGCRAPQPARVACVCVGGGVDGGRGSVQGEWAGVQNGLCTLALGVTPSPLRPK
jgi:hypothetical protein